MSDKLVRRRMAVALCGALLASAGARALQPTTHLADRLGKPNLEQDVPRQFGDWTIDPQKASVVNPQQDEVLKRLYSQILSENYRHKSGYRIMLAVAYVIDQRDALATHYPEVCYPAQGFKLRDQKIGMIQLPFGSLPVHRLDTAMGLGRQEPVTYWIMVGEQAVASGYRKKMADLHYTLRGLIPDGLLFRVSSIDPETERAYDWHARFIGDLLGATELRARFRLAGL